MSDKNKIKLENVLCQDTDEHLYLVRGEQPYIWIGDKNGCFGVVGDRSVRKLKRWCDEILTKRGKCK